MLFKRITSHLNKIEWKGQQLYYNIAFDKRTAALSFFASLIQLIGAIRLVNQPKSW